MTYRPYKVQTGKWSSGPLVTVLTCTCSKRQKAVTISFYYTSIICVISMNHFDQNLS